jgi:carboxymethylenebutenolidase
MRVAQLALVLWLIGAGSLLAAGGTGPFDELTRQQAALEREQMRSAEAHSQLPAMASYRQSAETVKYPSGEYSLPGYLYRPAGKGPFPAIIWNHGSERNPKAQPELARFYTGNGYVFFVPIRHGHGKAPGTYIGAHEDEIRSHERDRAVLQRKLVGLHELYNLDVVAAVAWLKEQTFVDPTRIVMSGCSYGGIQTVLTAEKGLGVRAFVPFAPAAMSFANEALRERLVIAARHAKAPIFLLQAQNDYSTGPSELLAPILKEKGEPSHVKVYPAFGKSNQEGHGAFACWSLGITGWGEDVLEFLDAAMKTNSTSHQKAAAVKPASASE